MVGILLPRAFVGALIALGLAGTAAQAQATHTFVSGHGVDGGACSLGAPCRSFQAAHDATAAGGEISVLDTAGYGAVTITKAINIVNESGGAASVQQGTFNQNAITINAGLADTVYLRGLYLDGLGIGSNGIAFNTGGNLSVSNCVARHFVNNGILIQPSSAIGQLNFVIANTTVAENAFGISYLPQSGGGANANGVIDHVQTTNNFHTGLYVNTQGSVGDIVNVSMSNSTFSNNGGNGYEIDFGSDNSLTTTVDSSYFSNNFYDGILASGAVSVLLGRSVITSNGRYGVESNTLANTFYSYGDNRVNKNVAADIGGKWSVLQTAFKPQ